MFLIPMSIVVMSFHVIPFIFWFNDLNCPALQEICCKCSAKDCVDVQELSEESSAAERYQNLAEELCRVPQAQELAMVETLY